MKLNIGAGYKRVDGFLNVDIDSNCNPDYVLDIERQSLPFADNTVDAVICHHILEHLGDGFIPFLKELYRVCIGGAIIDVCVPHPRHDIFLIDPTHKRPIYPDTIAMFSKKRNLADIEAGGCETTLGLIHDVDFEVVHVDYVLNPFYQRLFQTITNEQCDYIVQSNNNVIQEIIMKVSVNKNESPSDG
jgi:SAM-dependent methyltransferase